VDRLGEDVLAPEAEVGSGEVHPSQQGEEGIVMAEKVKVCLWLATLIAFIVALLCMVAS